MKPITPIISEQAAATILKREVMGGSCKGWVAYLRADRERQRAGGRAQIPFYEDNKRVGYYDHWVYEFARPLAEARKGMLIPYDGQTDEAFICDAIADVDFARSASRPSVFLAMTYLDGRGKKACPILTLVQARVLAHEVLDVVKCYEKGFPAEVIAQYGPRAVHEGDGGGNGSDS